MLTLTFENYCLPVGAFDERRAGRLQTGAAGQLVVAAVRAGRCHLPATGTVAEAGRLFALPAPAQLALMEDGRLQGVLLAGAAAAEVAAQLQTPLLVGGAAGLAADSLMGRLAMDWAVLPPAEASRLAYGLLCRLQEAAGGDTGPLPPLVAAAVAQIHEHCGEVYGVEELAEALQVSKGHLIRSFTAAVGMPPGKYLNLVRVENAKRLLAQEGHDLEIVATLCGFSGANYLCKVFKAQTGESPAAWRRKYHHPAAEEGAQTPAHPADAEWDEPEDAQLSVDEWEQQIWA